MTTLLLDPGGYKSVLVRLLSFLDNAEYSKDTIFPKERLADIKPDDLMRFFNLKIFGAENPTAEQRLRPQLRSTCLEFWKKALSYYMPNRLMQWNEIAMVGNPTRCLAVNDLIKSMKKAEVKNLGVQTQARRAMTDVEFTKIKELCYNLESRQNCVVTKYGVAAQMNFQFHLMARLDDTCNILRQNLEIHPNFPFALKTRLNWAKNCNEERDAPWQIVLGCVDSSFCVLISLSLWLVSSFEFLAHAKLTPYLFGFLSDCRFPQGGKSGKDLIRKYISTAIKGLYDLKGLIGAHSVRKFASTRVRKCGASKDDRDLRGRWKRARRVGDRYNDVELPWPDTKLATFLCIGGPCKYKLKKDSGIDNGFILRVIMKNVKEYYSDDVSIVLGIALLYYMFTENGRNRVPSVILQSVQQEFHRLHQRDLQDNPVEKIALVAHGSDGEVFLDEMTQEAEIQGPSVGGEARLNDENRALLRGMSERSATHQLRAIQSQLSSLKASVIALQEKVTAMECSLGGKMTGMQRNLKRLADAPGRRIRPPTGVLLGLDPNSRLESGLSSLPRTLYDLWDEYTIGLEGRKPAKLYSPIERGRCKHKYCRRKVVWGKIQELVNAGYTSHVAIDMILDHYGRDKTTTHVINLMKRDRTNKSYPAHLCYQ